MNKVIFICLLSIAACLSSPTGTGGPAPVPPQTSEDVTEAAPKPGDKGSNVPPSPPANVHPTEITTNASSTNGTPKATTAPVTEKAASTNPDDNKTKSDDKGKNEPSKDVKMPPTPAPTTNGTTSAEHDKKEATTAKPTETPKPKPTEAPKPTETPSKEDDKILQARKFDGASFVGGMILTLGLLAIGFMGFKYYKNQTERNYHTL